MCILCVILHEPPEKWHGTNVLALAGENQHHPPRNLIPSRIMNDYTSSAVAFAGLTGDLRNWPFEARFWSKVQVGEPDECWPWKAGVDKNGYGKIRDSYRDLRAHRVAWEFAFGPIPEGQLVLHRCDNPPCCNPFCLFLGDHAVNQQDCISKGRKVNRPGPANGQCKLSTSQVAEIRRLSEVGIEGKSLAILYDVSRAQISRIINGTRRATC